MRSKYGTVRAKCLEGLSRGITAREVDGPRSTASRNFIRLVEEGIAFGGGTHKDFRYFDTQEKADAYTAQSRAQCVLNRKKHRPRTVKAVGYAPGVAKKPAPKTRPGWGPDDPMTITPETKYTIAPAPIRSLRTNTHAQ